MDPSEKMISLEQALARIDSAIPRPTLSPVVVPVCGALGRVVAESVCSRIDLPPFDRSAMDGFAVGLEDHRLEFVVAQTIPAGICSDQAVRPGTAARIMTGAPIPPGAGRVIKVEDTVAQYRGIRVVQEQSETHIRKRGEDIQVGNRLVDAGTKLGAIEIANLVACGVDEVEVLPKIRTAIISTGDEIVDSIARLSPGKVIDSNGPMLECLALEAGLEVVSRVTVADAMDATVVSLSNALRDADLVLITGGVSVGDFDFVQLALERAGVEVHFSRLAVQPGKPTVFGSRGNRVAVGLPGNPVSAFVMFHLIALRAAARLCGMEPPSSEEEKVLGCDFRRKKAERTLFMPCRLSDGRTTRPLPYNGSGHLGAILEADGFFRVPEGVSELKEGGLVGYLPLERAIHGMSLGPMGALS